MKKISILFCAILLAMSSIAQNNLRVKQPYIPILLERTDNILHYIRLDAKDSKVLNSLTLEFSGDVNLEEVETIRLFYGGTEAVEREGQIHYAPTDYISSSTRGWTHSAIKDYSVLKDEVKRIDRKIILQADQKLFPDINYFWISIEMKKDANLSSTISSQITQILVDREAKAIQDDTSTHTPRRLAAGVRYAWDDGAAAYRIPGLVTTNDGTLLAVYDVRYNSSVDLQEYVDVGVSRSIDKGQTWEDMRLVMNFGEYGGLPRAQNGVGDPAILVDKTTGRIWVIAAWTHGMGNGRAWHNSKQGQGLTETAQLVLTKSDDDGKTWSQPINITQQIKDPECFFLLQGPGKGISMKDGTLVFPSQYIGADRVPNAGIIYSKDKGKTWNIHQHARNNTTESQVIELEDGTLMLNMRDNRGGSRAVSITRDMGRTWQEHPSSHSALIEPVCMASLIKVEAKDNVLGKDILLFSNPNSTEHRNNITIKASLDSGLTWKETNQILLDEGTSWGYSCLTMVDNETVGIIYESSVAHMTFQKVKLKDLVKSPKQHE